MRTSSSHIQLNEEYVWLKFAYIQVRGNPKKTLTYKTKDQNSDNWKSKTKVIRNGTIPTEIELKATVIKTKAVGIDIQPTGGNNTNWNCNKSGSIQ